MMLLCSKIPQAIDPYFCSFFRLSIIFLKCTVVKPAVIAPLTLHNDYMYGLVEIDVINSKHRYLSFKDIP